MNYSWITLEWLLNDSGMILNDFEWLWMTLEWLLNDSWMTLEWLWLTMNDCWMTLEWLVNDPWMTLEWLVNDSWMTLKWLWMTLEWLLNDCWMTLGWLSDDSRMTIIILEWHKEIKLRKRGINERNDRFICTWLKTWKSNPKCHLFDTNSFEGACQFLQ